MRVVFAVLVLAVVALAVLASSPAYAGSVSTAAEGKIVGITAEAEVQVGTVEAFWAFDWGSGTYSQIQATARYVGDRCIVYVHSSALFHNSLVAELGTAFDSVVYPILTREYGSEPNPGIDGDSRIAILIYDFHDDSVDGFFRCSDIDPVTTVLSNFPSSRVSALAMDDSDPAAAAAPSNYREMIHLNLQTLINDHQNMGAIAAHEFAHLITYYRDVMLDPSPSASAEDKWLSEGLSEFAEYLAGYDERVNNYLAVFFSDPGFNFTDWQGVIRNYGGAYAFVRYLAERGGGDFIRALVEQPLDGRAGVNAALGAAGIFDATFDTLYDDWVVSNFLNGRSPKLPPYLYSGLTASVQVGGLSGVMPIVGTGEVSNFGAVYLDIPQRSSCSQRLAVILAT